MIRPNAIHASEDWSLAPDEEIDGTLVVVRPLGAGSKYEVYEALDRGTSASVAVKVLRPEYYGDARRLARLQAEAELAARLEHPNLVRLLRWSAALPRPYLVFELVNAQTLDDHLDDVGPLGLAETCLLGMRIASALAYLHGAGILHLDVKPANVTLGAPPRLLDLSLARAGSEVRSERRVGTPAYMAPEQCRQETLIPATDIFGLGTTLYEAVTGMQTFSDGEIEATDVAGRFPQLVEEPTPLRDLLPGASALFDRVVTGCLARDPARRPAAREVSAALTRVLAEIGLRGLTDRR